VLGTLYHGAVRIHDRRAPRDCAQRGGAVAQVEHGRPVVEVAWRIDCPPKRYIMVSNVSPYKTFIFSSS